MFTKTTLAALAAISLVAGASAAFAGTPSDDTLSVKVSYQGLDLSSDAGAKMMLTRITHAAREICGPGPDARLFNETRAYQACVTAITNRAVTQLDSPKVTQVAGGQASTKAVAFNGR